MTLSRYGTCKRALDLGGALVLLLVSAPVLLLAAFAIRVTMGAPVVYRQRRAGLHGRPFTLLKLRTMRDGWTSDGRSIPDGERLTRLGRWLRATSLDELPGLWNVVRGDMSLVGPRPLLPEYLTRYSTEQARRHEVLPGVTGLVQTSGRNALSWDEKFALDVWYVDHRSIGLDLRILCRTPLAVLRRRGISAAGEATMPEFQPDNARTLGARSQDGLRDFGARGRDRSEQCAIS